VQCQRPADLGSNAWRQPRSGGRFAWREAWRATDGGSVSHISCRVSYSPNSPWLNTAQQHEHMIIMSTSITAPHLANTICRLPIGAVTGGGQLASLARQDPIPVGSSGRRHRQASQRFHPCRPGLARTACGSTSASSPASVRPSFADTPRLSTLLPVRGDALIRVRGRQQQSVNLPLRLGQASNHSYLRPACCAWRWRLRIHRQPCAAKR
jgi:hypothetical protein